VKGPHQVVEAILALPKEGPIQLDLFGPYWDSSYGLQRLKRISDDDRFRLMGNRPKDQLLPLRQGYDLEVVPSTWLETGPLTVLEAFTVGLPVAGSDLGGIMELLAGGAGRTLSTHAKSWQQFLQQVLINPEELKSPPTFIRGFSDVAMELLPVYG
jgi:glycosyltransferase involved in cell wall biosynthesis